MNKRGRKISLDDVPVYIETGGRRRGRTLDLLCIEPQQKSSKETIQKQENNSVTSREFSAYMDAVCKHREDQWLDDISRWNNLGVDLVVDMPDMTEGQEDRPEENQQPVYRYQRDLPIIHFPPQGYEPIRTEQNENPRTRIETTEAGTYRTWHPVRPGSLEQSHQEQVQREIAIELSNQLAQMTGASFGIPEDTINALQRLAQDMGIAMMSSWETILRAMTMAWDGAASSIQFVFDAAAYAFEWLSEIIKKPKHKKPFGRDVSPVTEIEKDLPPIGENTCLKSPLRNRSPGENGTV